jgi:hypothetical protein
MSVHAFRAAVGFTLLLPAGTLVGCSLLGLNPPASLIHPFLLIGGLAAALVMNLASTVSVGARCKDGALLGGLAIQFHGRALNLAVLLLGGLLICTIATYLFLENFMAR